jgi:threonine dehydrogenase-like Zn-dependent dehydrogenase
VRGRPGPAVSARGPVVGTPEAMSQALRATRPGGGVGIVGVPHDVSIDGEELFFSQVRVQGGPAPVRPFLPDLIDLIISRAIDPGQVFDLTCLSTRWPRATKRWTSVAA